MISPKLESIWFEDEYKSAEKTSYSRKLVAKKALRKMLPAKNNILQLFDLEDNDHKREQVSISTPFSFKHVSHIDSSESFGLEKSFKTNDLSLMTRLMSPSQDVEEQFEQQDLEVEDSEDESTSAAKTTLDPGASPLTGFKKTDSLPFQAFSSFRTTPTTAAPELDEITRKRHTRNYSSASSTNLLRSNSTFTRTTSISTLNTIVSNEVSYSRTQQLSKKHISICNSLNSLTANSSYQYSYLPHEKSEGLIPSISRQERFPTEGDDFINQPIKEEEEFIFDEKHEEGYGSNQIDPSIMEEEVTRPSSTEEETTARGSGFSNFSYVNSSSSSNDDSKLLIDGAQLASPIALSKKIVDTYEQDKYQQEEEDERENKEEYAPIELFEIDNKTIEDELEKNHTIQGTENEFEEIEKHNSIESYPPHIRKVPSITSPLHSRNSSFTFELLETPKFEKTDFTRWSPNSSHTRKSSTSKDAFIDLDLFESISDDEEFENTMMAVNAANHIRSSRISFQQTTSGLDRLAAGASLRNATVSRLRLPEIEDDEDF